ncbi:RidA family protein [Rhodococcus koreensis]
MGIEHVPGQLPAFSGATKSGNLVVTSGVVSDTVISQPGAEFSFEAEATEVVNRLRAILAEAGSSMSQVMRVDAYLSDAAFAADWNEAFVQAWGEPRPARCTTVTNFAIPGVRIELSVIAATE